MADVISSILADPEDDTPRLALADYRDKRGRPGTKPGDPLRRPGHYFITLKKGRWWLSWQTHAMGAELFAPEAVVGPCPRPGGRGSELCDHPRHAEFARGAVRRLHRIPGRWVCRWCYWATEADR